MRDISSGVQKVITTPELLRIFHSDGETHGKPKYSNLGWYLGQVLGSCIGLLEGEDWKKGRKLFDPPFTHSATTARIDITDSTAKEFVDNLPSMVADAPDADASSTDREKSDNTKTLSFPIVPAFQKYPFFLAANIIYGHMTRDEEDRLWTMAEKRLGLTPYLFIGGPYRYRSGSWVDPKAFGLLNDFRDEWIKYNKDIVQDRRLRGVKAPILSYWDAYEAGSITLENLLHTLDEMLMTNLDVTTHAVTWLITLLADNAEVKKELIEEIRDNLTNLPRYLAKSDSHLHRCFQEALRVRPPLIFSAGESASSVKNFDGILVKPGTMVLADVLAVNVRNPFWGKDAESFNPSRFKTIRPADLRYNLIAFGFNGRKCPGQYLGAQMSKAILAHLILQYDVQTIKGRQGQSDYKTDESPWVPMADVTIQLTRRTLQPTSTGEN
ncbi:Alpha-humulene 10-hydroxylase [Cytospora mali]|uniref:Alpha-humulene 10-hydroxylase n=1 Tax=Cytospora mali TaxID=578113 RepID=A0A194VH36_CYTMA|nr:Alpha-humulene 10-hydroxylase [Valsa mali var. pyri (nom. inval.)]